MIYASPFKKKDFWIPSKRWEKYTDIYITSVDRNGQFSIENRSPRRGRWRIIDPAMRMRNSGNSRGKNQEQRCWNASRNASRKLEMASKRSDGGGFRENGERRDNPSFSSRQSFITAATQTHSQPLLNGLSLSLSLFLSLSLSLRELRPTTSGLLLVYSGWLHFRSIVRASTPPPPPPPPVPVSSTE